MPLLDHTGAFPAHIAGAHSFVNDLLAGIDRIGEHGIDHFCLDFRHIFLSVAMPASAQVALVKEDRSYNFQDIKNQSDSFLGAAGLALFRLVFLYLLILI